ncbi:hypothetical protein LRAMOSA08248 [Lichtheimia ramosa]|uniref:NADH dehydrogenase [ubiquinone] 1 alpha subcomplex subunit n=1 Tax=Lichtheimia ramosa TaxID=688394 RepID=A0A077WE58_9FUNG|nr:hypothetical protein LRAMOSA08248 [Lichtheimia ramosa]
MSTKAPLSTLQRLRLIYKTSRFPWKKHVMVGWDLDGNEYWEMPNPNNPEGRWKRWVQLKEHDGDVGLFEENKLPVQWQAWLRHTRFEAPRIQELVQEQRRLAILRERVRKLEIAEQEEKLRLANKQQDQEQPSVQEQKEKELPAFKRGFSEGGDEPEPWTPSAPARRR